MQNEIDQKSEWQTPVVVDLDVKYSESGSVPDPWNEGDNGRGLFYQSLGHLS